jgi:5-methylcytosine-specific restriction protein B
MKIKRAEDVYPIFDNFIATCILKSNSLLTDDNDIFTMKNIEDCIQRFVVGYKDDSGNYENKINEQFAGASNEAKIVFAHANWLWAMSVSDITVYGKKNKVQICLPQGKQMNANINYFPRGFGSAGTYHKQNKYWEVASIIKFLSHLKKNTFADINSVKLFVEKMCLYAKYETISDLTQEIIKDLDSIPKQCAMYNILLYLCNPDKYERIASDTHKNRIVNSFTSLLGKSEADGKSIDEIILLIRDKLSRYRIGRDFDFYEEPKVSQIWNPEATDSEFNEIQGLSFKNNIILYGPPGTGKTYTAISLAKSFVIQGLIKTDPNNVKAYFESKIDVDARVKRLQLHSNYSYEDFIAGTRIKDGNTFEQKGDFLNLCERVSKDKAPYVLILDEINRIDLSRLFGEAFSGIENRNQEIDLSVGGFKITVPDNLYIIGTMNEIDFSLERLDFALRRRFLWFKYGFSPDALQEIIRKKMGNLDIEGIDQFVEKTILLNERIDELKELGKQYEIGHTFFSEVIDISHKLSGTQGYMHKIKLFKKNGPVQVLWDISIEPMLQAFLGNLDESSKKEKIKEMQDLFLNVKS